MNGWLIALCVIAFIVLVAIFIKIYAVITTGRDQSATCLVGKTVIVTGANSGIGFYAAQDFAKRGARVILACRDPKKAEDARAKIVEATGNQNVTVGILDLSSLASVREFAAWINESEERLDILVNNAGVSGVEHTITPDGMSLLMQTNYFGPFLLTILLLDILKRSAPSRIVMVASIMAAVAKLDPNDLNAPNRGIFGNMADYANTKLLNILFANELARKLKSSGIDVNSLCPGAVHTDIFKYLTSTRKKILTFFTKIFYKAAHDGAQTTIYVSVSKDIEGVTGEYFRDCKKGWMPRRGRDSELARNVWDIAEAVVKLTPKEKMSL